MATLQDYYAKVQSTLNSDFTKYNITNFIETGTGLGDTVSYVLNASDKSLNVYSFEIHELIAERASLRFTGFQNCKIICKPSYEGLRTVVPDLKGNTAFFLDAHFPGADFGYANYSDAIDFSTKLPLEQELNLLKASRNLDNDIFFIDDLRIYEEGTYESGNWTKENGATHAGIDFVYDLLEKTHNITKHYFYSGFITAFPKL